MQEPPPGGRRGPGPHRRGGGHGFPPGGMGPMGPGMGRGPRGTRGRGRRGDVRAAVLTLLAECPMHGYQLMQTISERSGGRWAPSPGAVYPTISALEDEGLVEITDEGGRKQVALTDAGRAYVSEQSADWSDPFRGGDGVNLRELVMQVNDAVRQVGRAGTTEQQERAAALLTTLRRQLYLLLAEEPESTTEQ